MVYIVVGGSCSGKTEFALSMVKNGYSKVITNTTRARRSDDFEGAYNFLTVDEFKDKIVNGSMLEYVKYNGNYYGTDIDSLVDNSVIVLEPQGAMFIKEKLGDNVSIIFLDVTDEERVRRGILRGDSIEVIRERIKEDKVLFQDEIRLNADYVLTDETREGTANFIDRLF